MADDGTASGSATPGGRFTTSQASGEKQLSDQTVGLVHLSDFRKRRAEALDDGAGSRASTPPTGDEAKPSFKKKLKKPKKGGLSFGDEDEETSSATTSATASRSRTPITTDHSDSATYPDASTPLKKLSANAALPTAATLKSKSVLAREATQREALRAEYLSLQNRVKATDFILPFVFFDGRDGIGGKARLKKGDQVWRFLDAAKRIGAEREVRKWARVAVDDLMLVKDFLIIPQHLEFYWFMQNRTRGYSEAFFPHSADVTRHSPSEKTVEEAKEMVGGLSVPGQKAKGAETGKGTGPRDEELEGFEADASVTKVVLRPWYEKHKHIYPMSTWKDFATDVDWSKQTRKDADGNAFFSSS